MTPIRFVKDSQIELPLADGGVVSLHHRVGEVAELGESLARLFIDAGVAIRVAIRRPDVQRADAPRGEQR